jgi:hypothetical protein
MDYTTETSFTRLLAVVSQYLALVAKEFCLPKHMDDGLVYGLTTISLQIELFLVVCILVVQKSKNSSRNVYQLDVKILEFNKISLIKNGKRNRTPSQG